MKVTPRDERVTISVHISYGERSDERKRSAALSLKKAVGDAPDYSLSGNVVSIVYYLVGFGNGRGG